MRGIRQSRPCIICGKESIQGHVCPAGRSDIRIIHDRATKFTYNAIPESQADASVASRPSSPARRDGD